ncbi:hypothetical protein BC829DRAFT_493638 [Chytridium lagenaria]|nr:hypothetical protein BC829DRAFT_493638 [Chytridium lagenaria]
MAAIIIPSQTLFVKSVYDKLKKHEIKRSLYHLFSQHGQILDVVTRKTAKMRGQAFVVFSDTSEATAALRALQGFPFFGKALVLAYSKSTSNAVMLREGRMIPPKMAQKMAKGKRGREEGDEGERDAKKAATEDKENGNDDEGDDEEMEMDDDDEEEEDTSAPAAPTSNPPEKTTNPPYNILYATHLPSAVTGTPEMLTLLFKQYQGFKEVRLVPNKSDIAFIEYTTVEQAVEAKGRLDGFLVAKGHPLKLQFAKR